MQQQMEKPLEEQGMMTESQLKEIEATLETAGERRDRLREEEEEEEKVRMRTRSVPCCAVLLRYSYSSLSYLLMQLLPHSSNLPKQAALRWLVARPSSPP